MQTFNQIPAISELPAYDLPVQALLTHGQVEETRLDPEWLNYLETFGFDASHIPDLIRLATDPWFEQQAEDPNNRLPWDHPVWDARVHALRALAQLQAVDAIEPLLAFSAEHDNSDDHDFESEEIVKSLTRLGPSGFSILEAALSDETRPERVRILVGDVLSQIVKNAPDLQPRFITLATQELNKKNPDFPNLNGFLISDLMTFQGKEAAPLIESLYEAGCVAEDVCGSLDDVLIELGVREATPEYLEKQARFAEFMAYLERQEQRHLLEGSDIVATPHAQRHAVLARQLKQKRKHVKQSRKANRKS